MLKKMGKSEPMSGPSDKNGEGLGSQGRVLKEEQNKKDRWVSQKPQETGWPTEVCEENRQLA